MPYVLRYMLGEKPTDRWARALEAPETTHDLAKALRFDSRTKAEDAADEGPWEVEEVDGREDLADFQRDRQATYGKAMVESIDASILGDEAPRADAP